MKYSTTGPYPGGFRRFSWTPLQVNDIHNYCYAFEKLRAEMYLLYFFMLIQHKLASYSFMGYNIKTERCGS